MLLNKTDYDLTLFSRSAASLPEHSRVTKIGASVFEKDALKEAIRGSQLVFASLSGNLVKMGKAIIEAMDEVGVKLLIFITSYGIYGEITGHPISLPSILNPYRGVADMIEKSDLDYTILRCGWFNDSSDHTYQLIPKNEKIYGHDISRFAIADFVTQCSQDPKLYIHQNFGMVR